MRSMVVIDSNFADHETMDRGDAAKRLAAFTCFLEGRSLACITYFFGFFISVSLYPQLLISLLYPPLVRSLSNHPEQDFADDLVIDL